MLLVVCSVVELHGCSVFDTISQLIGEQGTVGEGTGALPDGVGIDRQFRQLSRTLAGTRSKYLRIETLVGTEAVFYRSCCSGTLVARVNRDIVEPDGSNRRKPRRCFSILTREKNRQNEESATRFFPDSSRKKRKVRRCGVWGVGVRGRTQNDHSNNVCCGTRH